ncbi:MAG: hypothetical protein ABI867_27810 [Kofleriaceae bacterium]
MKAALLVVLVACVAPSSPPVLHPEVQAGPAAAAKPNRVLVLHAACGSVEQRCPRAYIDAVDAIVRGGLEFAGYNLVEGETLRNQTRERHEEHTSETTTTNHASRTHVQRDWAPDDHITSTSQGGSTKETSLVVLDGPGFEDLAVDERRDVLDKAGADAVLSVRIVIGGQIGVWVPNQNVEVMVKLGVNLGADASSDAMAWASRCSASSNEFATVDAALEHAARCAIQGGTARQ